MSIVQKLIWLLSRQVTEKSENQQMVSAGSNRVAIMESVKLILTKGTFLLSQSDEEYKKDLFLFGTEYIEISLYRDTVTPIKIRVLPHNGIELEEYLIQISLDDLHLQGN